MTIKTLIANWKTTSAGLLLLGGSVINLIFAIRAHTATEQTWTLTLGAILGGLGLIFAGDASASSPATPPAVEPPASKLPLLLLLGALAFAPAAVVVTGCKQPQTRAAVVFNTFRSSWSVTHQAYAAWCERVVAPGSRITQAQSDQVDAAWNKYRAAFKVAFSLAAQNWTQPTDATLAAAEAQILSLIRSFAQ